MFCCYSSFFFFFYFFSSNFFLKITDLFIFDFCNLLVSAASKEFFLSYTKKIPSRLQMDLAFTLSNSQPISIRFRTCIMFFFVLFFFFAVDICDHLRKEGVYCTSTAFFKFLFLTVGSTTEASSRGVLVGADENWNIGFVVYHKIEFLSPPPAYGCRLYQISPQL